VDLRKGKGRSPFLFGLTRKKSVLRKKGGEERGEKKGSSTFGGRAEEDV